MAERRDIATRFQPGNKFGKGRPRGTTDLNALLRKALGGYSIGGTETPDGRTIAEHFIEYIIGHAMGGNAALAKEIFERVSGKVPDAEPVKTDTTEVVKKAKAKRDERLKKRKPT